MVCEVAYECRHIYQFIGVCWQETLDHFSKFVRGSVAEWSGSEGELVKSALQLLQTLPATRSAVLQYITDIYDRAVNQHLEQRKKLRSLSVSAFRNSLYKCYELKMYMKT